EAGKRVHLRRDVRSGTQGLANDLRGPWCSAGEEAYQVGAPSEARENAPACFPDPEGPPGLPDKPSIAVLPFENLSGDPEQEYFGEGMVPVALSTGWFFSIILPRPQRPHGRRSVAPSRRRGRS